MFINATIYSQHHKNKIKIKKHSIFDAQKYYKQIHIFLLFLQNYIVDYK
jgi:hypothetical protein